MSYWEDRQEQLNKQMEKDEETLKKRLSSFYDAEYQRLDREIASYYQMYGKDNVIKYKTLMQTLTEAERNLLIQNMDGFALKYPRYAHLLPVRASIYKLNRLEALQQTIILQQLEIGAVNNEQIEAHLNKQALRGANAAKEMLGFGKNFYANNSDITNLFVNVAWSNGENFSQKIWKNADKLARYLNTDIAQGIARGDSYEKLTKKLRERFGKVTRNDAYRLIYTEGTYVMAEATMQPFVEDFENYRVSTVGDGKVCEICSRVAEQVFSIAHRQPGVNFPPLHPWCRCTFTIEVEDWDKWMDDYKRRHGGETSKQAAKIANNIEKKHNFGIINSGATSGALDPNSARAEQHAIQYYESVRHMTNDVNRIAQNTGWKPEAIRKIKKYIFEDEHDLLEGYARFAPSYDMAQSWQRLIDGKNIKEQDLVLLKHEYLEMILVERGLPQNEAHVQASIKHNYAKYLE